MTETLVARPSGFLPILKILGLVTIALIPAVALYLLFGELSSATVQWSDEASLGGPVAAFFATLLLLNQIHKRMIGEDRAEDVEAEVKARLGSTRLRSEMADLIAGTWEIRSEAMSTGRQGLSRTEIGFKDGHVEISGGTLANQAAPDVVVGDWHCEMAVFDGNRLLYSYVMNDQDSTHPVSRGVVLALLQKEGGETKLVGTWQMFGGDAHSGKIELARVG